ncbi:MAG: thioredoxin-disulfide reductase [Firmicutes bacterium]|nr:thioredoxin-disulfide reductase [Bacillota bacterium]
MEKIYDVIIIGAGPAGLSAAIYAGRSKLSTLVVESNAEGGQIITTDEIANYPGSYPPESGHSLIARMSEQARAFGAEFVSGQVDDVCLDVEPKTVSFGGNEYYAKTVIIAAGAHPAKIGCKGEDVLTGAGVSYCATCDGPFFEGLPVYVVGGGDAAVEEAMYLTKFASSVTIIHRRDSLKAAKSIQDKAFANEKISFLWNTTVYELKGEDFLESMVLKNTVDGSLTEVTGQFGLFVFIGTKPNTALYDGLVEMQNGFIVTDAEMRTSVPGVFAAGDARVKTLRQVVTAVADGAIAAVSAEKYLEDHASPF